MESVKFNFFLLLYLRFVLTYAPSFGHLIRIDQLELPTITSPADERLRRFVHKQLEKELPQLYWTGAWRARSYTFDQAASTQRTGIIGERKWLHLRRLILHAGSIRQPPLHQLNIVVDERVVVRQLHVGVVACSARIIRWCRRRWRRCCSCSCCG